MSNRIEDIARGSLETLLRRRLSDQAWERDKKRMRLLGLPLDLTGVRLYANLKSHIPNSLEKILGVQKIPNCQMVGSEILKDFESREWMPKAFSTFQRWFDRGFRLGETYTELEVTLVYLRAFIYQKRQLKTKELGESSNDS